MAWTEGVVKLPANFHNGTPTPLDGKTVVEVPEDLESITAPYKGMIVHVANGDAKTYVCVDETALSGSVDNATGVPLPAVWKELGAGGGSSTTATLDDQDPAPTGAADKVILYSADEDSAESRPDHLYLFDESVNDSAALDSGRDGTGNTGLKASTSGVNFTGGVYVGGYGNSAIFASGNAPSIRVGSTYAPYYMTGAGSLGTRADFEFQFLFHLTSLNRVHTLISSDPPTHLTDNTGFYSILITSSSVSGASTVTLEYYYAKDEVLEWTIPGTLSTTNRHHLALSFFEDDRRSDTDPVAPSVGKFRCYLDGVALEDKNTPGALSIAGSFVQIGRTGSTVPPVYLGQYLNGSAAAGPAALFHFASNYTNDVSGGPTMSVQQGSGGSVTNNTTHPTVDAAFGTQLRITNTNYWDTNYVSVDLSSGSPLAGTGAFTIEFFVDFGASTTVHPLSVIGVPAASGSPALFLSITNSVITLSHSSSQIMWCTDGGNTAPKIPYPSGIGTMKHFVLQRSAEGVGGSGNVTWKLGFDGAWIANHAGGYSNPVIPYYNITASPLYLGFNTTGSYIRGLLGAWIDDLSITASSVYSGTSTVAPLTYTAPTAPFVPPLDPSARFLEGKMHEFAMYNHRCLHNTSDTFERPTVPTRSTPLSVASVADSENTHSHILTAGNLGMLLPKHIEGLADGSAWNDKGVVKIAPLTGDLDSVPDPVVDNVLSLSARTTPAAGAGVAKIYAKDVLATGTPNYLLHLDNALTNEGTESTAVTRPGTYNVDSIFDSSGGNIKFGSHSMRLDPQSPSSSPSGDFLVIPHSTSMEWDNEFTIDFWMKMSSTMSGRVGSTQVYWVMCPESATLGNTGIRIAYYNKNHSSWGRHFQLGLPIVGNASPWGYFDLNLLPSGDIPTDAELENWNHYAFVRHSLTGGDWKFYVNGKVLPAGSYNAMGSNATVAVNTAGDDYFIGRYYNRSRDLQVDTFDADCWIDEFRIVKGSAEFASTGFTPSTSPYSAVDITKLFCMDSLGNETQLTP